MQFHDVQNSAMFRDGSVNSMVFQRDIQIYKHWRSKSFWGNLQTTISLKHGDTLTPFSQVNNKHSTYSIYILQNSVKTIIQQTHTQNDIDVTSSWNSLFHGIVESCNLVSEYPLDTLWQCYQKGNDCGHTEHVNLENTTINTLYLTILEHLKQHDPNISSNIASLFIHFTIYQNPVWDLGLQHKLLSQNFNKDYSSNLKDIQTYNSNCTCPCSSIFDWWHRKKGILKMRHFQQCDIPKFTDTIHLSNIYIQNKHVITLYSYENHSRYTFSTDWQTSNKKLWT